MADLIAEHPAEMLIAILAIAAVIGLALFGRARRRHIERLRSRLRGEVSVPDTFRERLAKALNVEVAEVATIGTVTFVDMAWHYSMADPSIWDHFHGASASHMADAIQNLEVLTASLGQEVIPVVDHLINYFQQLEAVQVFHNLVDSLPNLIESKLLVLESQGATLIEKLTGHALTAKTLAGAAQSLSESGMSGEATVTSTGSVLTHVPFVTIGFAAYRAWRRSQRGAGLLRNIEFGAIEVATRTSGGLIGGKVGGVIGSFIVPGVGTIIGSVAGAMAGTFGGARLGEAIKRRHVQKAQQELDESLTALGRTYLEDRYQDLATVFVAQEQSYLENLRQTRQRLYRYAAAPWRILWPDEKLILLQETVAMAQQRLSLVRQGTIEALDRLAYMRERGQYREMGIILWSDPALCRQLPCDTGLIDAVREANKRLRCEMIHLGALPEAVPA